MQKYTDVFDDNQLGCCYAFTNDGTKFLFDACDAKLVASRGWHMSKRGYVAGKEHRKERPLHKLMIEVDSGFDIDHINRDKTDYRRNNLRVCSHQHNCFNQRRRNTNSSGFIGVSFAKNILRGYVPVDKNWTGFSAEDYQEACESIEQQQEEPVAGMKRLNMAGFQRVRAGFFPSITDPSMTISDGKIRFNTACLKKFEDVEYVELLLNTVKNCIAIC